MNELRIVALGGGHGLAASLAALRLVTPHVTAVVTVADDGGSSGRLRRELGVLPPGDLRQALAALCRDATGDDPLDDNSWREVLQHRFQAEGSLQGHALGNLLLVALLELHDGDPVRALDAAGRLLGISGRVLPMSAVPLVIGAAVRGGDALQPDEVSIVRGQVAVAQAPGRVEQIFLEPSEPRACPEAVTAIRAADAVVLGPGSWFSSVLPHLLVPEITQALKETSARRIVILNLAPQPGETDDFRPETHLDVLAEHAPGLRFDVVLADSTTVSDPEVLVRVARELGAVLRLESVGSADGAPRHDQMLLAAALKTILEPGIPATGSLGHGAGTVAGQPGGRREETEGSVQTWQ